MNTVEASLKVHRPSNGLTVLLSFWAVALLAAPYWWHSTSIQRLSLPEIGEEVSSALNAVAFQETLCLRFDPQITGNFDLDVVSLENSVQKKLQDQLKRVKQAAEGEVIIIQTACHPELEEKSTPSHFSIHVQASPKREQPPPYITSEINGSNLNIVLPDSLLSASSSKITSDVSTYIFKALSHFFPSPKTLLATPDSRIVKYAQKYRVAFTLVNEDLNDGGGAVDWNIEQGLRRMFQPLMHSLEPLHNFTVESQVQFYAPLTIEPFQPDRSSPWIVSLDDAKAFINDGSWSLNTATGSESEGDGDIEQVIQFVVFVPSAKRRPLVLEIEKGSTRYSDSFLVPQWGGLFIYNPPEPNDTETTSALNSNHCISIHQLQRPLSTFFAQFHTLLGIPPLPQTISIAPQYSGGISSFQLSHLARRRSLENIRDAVGGVKGIRRLVEKIQNMRVGKSVKDDYMTAVNQLNQIASSNPSSPLSAFVHSAIALRKSSQAFFNPTMLGLLYFPDEHKAAVYGPLFGPIAVPLVVGLLKELSRRRRMKRQAAAERKLRETREKVAEAFSQKL